MHADNGFTRGLLRGLALSLVVGVGLVASVALGSAATGGGAATTTTTTAKRAPANTAAPAISGTARDGSTLTASRGTWTNSPSRYEFQWLRCDSAGANCASIAGATSQTYVVASVDVGHRLRVTVTASSSGGAGTATSKPTAVVAAAGEAPAMTAKPALTGDATQGSTLTANTGSWKGSTPIAYAYQWLRCDSAGGSCAGIGGATQSTYVLVGDDVGRTVRVQVTATNARGSSNATSDQTSLVAPRRSTQSSATRAVDQVSLPDRLIVDRVKWSPRVILSRAPVVARFHVVDTRGFAIQGALVYALGLPYSWTANAAEQPTDEHGWATITMRPTIGLPLRRGALVVFVRARKPGDNLLAGVSTRRLVQISIR